MRTRTATQADLAPLCTLFEQRWHDAHGAVSPPELLAVRTAADFAYRLRGYFDAGDLHVAGAVGAPVGFFALKGPHIDQLYVDVGQVGTGLAQQLLADAEALLRRRGHARAELWCNTQNPRAAAFYAKSGWTCRATETVALDSASGRICLPCFVFEKSLD